MLSSPEANIRPAHSFSSPPLAPSRGLWLHRFAHTYQVSSQFMVFVVVVLLLLYPDVNGDGGHRQT